MTLDEAIQHAREVAREKRIESQECLCAQDWASAEACHECCEEHEQLAEWLEELRDRHTREELPTMIGAGAPAAPVIFDDGKVRAVLVTGHQTNGDLLRAMTDEQLVAALGLSCARCAYSKPGVGACLGETCKNGNLKWLRQEAAHGD